MSRAFQMMLDLLKSYNSFSELEEWAERYGHTIVGKRYSDQWRNAVDVCVRAAENVTE